MILAEMLFDRSIPPESLRTAIAQALSLSAQDVEVVKSIEGALSSSPVVAEYCHLDGEFPFQVAIYVHSTPLSLAVVEVAQSVAASLSTNVLISDDELNPYSMTLVTPTGTTAAVYLDVEALDSRGAYVVRKPRKGTSRKPRKGT